MVSRTFEGKHTTRFIIEVYMKASKCWGRSGNAGLRGFFATRALAEAALAAGYRSTGLRYRVRQK